MGIEQFIDNEVKANDVVLFMKGTPQFPQCGFSGQVVQILDHLGVAYKGINVLESDDIRDGIKAYSNFAGVQLLHGMVAAVVAEFQFEGLAAQGDAGQLVA